MIVIQKSTIVKCFLNEISLAVWTIYKIYTSLFVYLKQIVFLLFFHQQFESLPLSYL